MKRLLFAAAIVAAIALIALRDDAPPAATMTSDTISRDAAHVSTADEVSAPKAGLSIDARANVEKDARPGVVETTERSRRTAIVAMAPKRATTKPLPAPARQAVVTRETTAPSLTYAQAMAQFIDSTDFADTASPLARLYFASFNRFPDQEGLDYYIAQRAAGRSLDSIAEEFLGSREFDMRYGAIDNATFVDRVFDNVFGVAPDAAQRAYWIGQLDSGISRGQLILAFSEGADFQILTANEVFVAAAYVEALRRTPDDAGFAHWVEFLDAGNPREAVIEGLLATDALRNAGRNRPRGG